MSSQNYEDVAYNYAKESLSKRSGPLGIVATWEGVPITRFTREELIEILERLGQMMVKERESQSKSFNLMAKLSRC